MYGEFERQASANKPPQVPQLAKRVKKTNGTLICNRRLVNRNCWSLADSIYQNKANVIGSVT